MIRRQTRAHDVPKYEIRVGEQVLHMTPREVCQLACEIETWFRENREQLIEDVCEETTSAVLGPATAQGHRPGQPVLVPQRN